MPGSENRIPFPGDVLPESVPPPIVSDFATADAASVVAQAESTEREIEAIGVEEAATIDGRWSEALDTAIEAKEQQADRLVDRLETMLEVQETRVSQALGRQPGVIALPGQRARAQRQIADAQLSLTTITARLERVREIRDEPNPNNPRSVPGLAREALERTQPALASEWEATRIARTVRELEERKARREAELREGRGQTLSQRPGQS